MRNWATVMLAVAALSCAAGGASATVPLQKERTVAAGTWLVWGGEITIEFNPDALAALGLSIEQVNGAKERIVGEPGVRYEAMTFRMRDDAVLEVRHTGNKIESIGGGRLGTDAGFVFAHGGERYDLTGLGVRAAAGTLFDLEIVDRSGLPLFIADHAHYGFDDAARVRFGMRNMNLRLSPAFADRLGQPELAGHSVGGLGFSARAAADAAAPVVEGGTCNEPWPTAGLVTDIQTVFRLGPNNWTGQDDNVVVKRCGLPGGGSCSGASTTGNVVIAPDSSLVNIGQTAVPWYQKFASNSPPYNNDQHPILVWNLYRVETSGRIKQIGVSGVKHAFTTINFACSCADDHIIYPGCEDTYSSFNNDTSVHLGPRSEIIPFEAKWGRCGSIFDADCNGQMNGGSGAATLYDQRMRVTESDLQAGGGAKYYFEYWYIVRDDQNIYNTMGYREITASKNGSGSWSVQMVNNVAPHHNFYEGPVINFWVDPAAPGANAANRELSTPLGRARVAVKATDLGGGQWRYRYALMNFDYAHVDIDPAHNTEPNLKVTANVGFDRFSVPSSGTATDVAFFDADGNAANDWTSTTTGGSVTWTAPTTAASLTWGTFMQFEFTSNVAPVAADVGVRGGATPAQAAIDYTQTLLAPTTSDVIFANGFQP